MLSVWADFISVNAREQKSDLEALWIEEANKSGLGWPNTGISWQVSQFKDDQQRNNKENWALEQPGATTVGQWLKNLIDRKRMGRGSC